MAPVKLPVVNGEYLNSLSGSRTDIKAILAKEHCIPLFIRSAHNAAPLAGRRDASVKGIDALGGACGRTLCPGWGSLTAHAVLL